MTTIQAIPTRYNGIEFRSRLEARWAAFFDLIGWKWEYEPFDAAGYIPDFAVYGASPMLVEVKPAVTLAELETPVDRITLAVNGHPAACDILIVGTTPLFTIPEATGLSPGLLAERDTGWPLAPAAWIQCEACGLDTVIHTTSSYQSRICGHYDGDHYNGQPREDRLRAAWAAATNTVRWAPRNGTH